MCTESIFKLWRKTPKETRDPETQRSGDRPSPRPDEPTRPAEPTPAGAE